MECSECGEPLKGLAWVEQEHIMVFPVKFKKNQAVIAYGSGIDTGESSGNCRYLCAICAEDCYGVEPKDAKFD